MHLAEWKNRILRKQGNNIEHERDDILYKTSKVYANIILLEIHAPPASDAGTTPVLEQRYMVVGREGRKESR